jgi:hypothetical protein
LTRRVASEKTASIRIRSREGRRAVAAVADGRIAGDKPLINEMRRVQASDERLHDEAKREDVYDGASARPSVVDGHARNYCDCIAMPTPMMVLSSTRQFGHVWVVSGRVASQHRLSLTGVREAVGTGMGRVELGVAEGPRSRMPPSTTFVHSFR